MTNERSTMKIVVIGGTGLIGSKVAAILRGQGHEVVAAALDTGVNVLTGAGLAEAMAGADVVVDLMSTGSTMRVHNLRVVATILESSARLITALPSSDTSPAARERARALNELGTALESVLRGRGQRYVMANVPRDALDRVKRILPGLNGPTVIDILNGGRHVAVHAVVPQCAVYRTITDLKSLGAEGILVTRIERLMP